MWGRLSEWIAGRITLPKAAVIKRLLSLFEDAELTQEEYALCTAVLLRKIRALPIRDILIFDEHGTIVSIAGRPLEIEVAMQLREGAKVMLRNPTRRVIRDQMRWLAISVGIHQGFNESQVIFAKAALWLDDEENKLYRLIAQIETEEDTGEE